MEMQDGRYQAVTKQRLLAETKNGNPEIAFDFELTQEGFVGQRMQAHQSLNGGAFDFTIKAARATGWTGSDLNNLDEGTLGPVTLVIENESYTNPETGIEKTTPKVKWINAPGGIAAKPMAEDRKKDFAQQMKARILAFDQANPKAAPASAAPKSAATNDDIPF